MYVCETCHNRDKEVTKCMTPFTHHPIHIMSPCDVCGRVDILAKCWAYSYLNKTENIRCLYAKSATSGIDE